MKEKSHLVHMSIADVDLTGATVHPLQCIVCLGAIGNLFTRACLRCDDADGPEPTIFMHRACIKVWHFAKEKRKHKHIAVLQMQTRHTTTFRKQRISFRSHRLHQT